MSDAMQLDVSRSNSQHQLDTKSSASMTSPSSSSSHHHDDVMQSRRCTSPLETATGSDVMEQPRGRLIASPHSLNPAAMNTMEELRPDSTAGPLIRRRAVNLSDLRSCALVQTQMKTRKASASWRYVSNVFCSSNDALRVVHSTLAQCQPGYITSGYYCST